MAGTEVPARLRGGHAKCVEAPASVARRPRTMPLSDTPGLTLAFDAVAVTALRYRAYPSSVSVLQEVAFGVPRETPWVSRSPGHHHTGLGMDRHAVAERAGETRPPLSSVTSAALQRHGIDSCGSWDPGARPRPGPVPRETTRALVNLIRRRASRPSRRCPTESLASATRQPLWTSDGEVKVKAAGRPGMHPVPMAKDPALEAAGAMQRYIHQDLPPWPDHDEAEMGRTPVAGRGQVLVRGNMHAVHSDRCDE
jgi:hypothetical protein